MLTAEQIAERRKGIGGSDIAAILGLSRFRTALEVYAHKVGLWPEKQDSEYAEWGSRLEPVIAEKYADEEGVHLHLGSRVVGHPEPWMHGSADALVYGEHGEVVRGLEIKTCDARYGWEWGPSEDDVPDAYACQARWYMAVYGLPEWDVAVLIGGNTYRRYRLTRRADIERDLIEAGRRFWHDNVLKQIPPAEPNPEVVREFLRYRYRETNGQTLQGEGNETLTGMLRATLDTRKAAAEAERAKVAAENALKGVMGEATAIDFGPDGWVTWRADKNGKRTLRLPKTEEDGNGER